MNVSGNEYRDHPDFPNGTEPVTRNPKSCSAAIILGTVVAQSTWRSIVKVMHMVLARVYLVRHGETEENRRKIVQGHMDTVLNAVGIEQSRLVAEALRKVPFAIAFSSDLQRARMTAQAILTHHPNVPLQEQHELRERMLGIFQGKDVAYRRTHSPDDSVESSKVYARRTTTWWEQTIVHPVRTQSAEVSNGIPLHILVVTHGGFISTLLRSLMSSKEVACAENVVVGKYLNTSVTVIDVDAGGKGTVVQCNDTSHLVQTAVEENVDEIRC